MSVLKNKDEILEMIDNLNVIYSLLDDPEIIKVIYDKDLLVEDVIMVTNKMVHFLHVGNIVLDITVNEEGDIESRTLYIDNDFNGIPLRDKIVMIRDRRLDDSYTRLNELGMVIDKEIIAVECFMKKEKDLFVGLSIS